MIVLLLSTAWADIAPPPDIDAMPRLVAASCGDVYALQALSFTFVAAAGEDEKARRSHTWSPQTGALTVTTGGESTALVTRAAMPTTADDPAWAELAPGTTGEAALEAWSAFVNDSYWLLAPCKVMDDGVASEMLDAGRMQLTFAGVGLTPGDRYTLQVGSAGEVSGWSYTLQSGTKGEFTWSAYEQVGPLRLSLRRYATDGSFSVLFEDVSAQ